MFDRIPAGEPAMEKMVYSAFVRGFVAMRRTDLTGRTIDATRLTLPNDAVLHTWSNLLTPDHPDVTPDVTLPAIVNEALPRYLSHNLVVAGPNSQPFPVAERYVFSPAPILAQTQSFQRQHPEFRRVQSPDHPNVPATALLITNHNPLLRARLMGGRLLQLRRFDLALRSLLNHLVAFPQPKHHYLQVPLTEHLYSKLQVERTFKAFDVTTVRVFDDPSYYFLLHLLGYVADAPTSLLRQLPAALLDRVNIILQCRDRAIVYNLGLLKGFATQADGAHIPGVHLQVLRHLNALKLVALKLLAEDEAAQDTPEQQQRLDALETELVRPDQTDGADGQPLLKTTRDPARTVVLITGNPEVIAKHQQEAKAYYDAIARYVRELGYAVEIDAGADYTVPESAALWIGHSRGADRLRFAEPPTQTLAFGSPITGAINAPGDTPTAGGPVTAAHFTFTDAQREAIRRALQGDASPGTSSTSESRTAAQNTTSPPKPLVQELREASGVAIAANQMLTPEQQAKAATLYDRQLAVVVGGKTIDEHMNASGDVPVPKSELDFLKGKLVDPSMATSSIVAYDQLYIQEMLDRDLALMLASLSASGMFVQSVKEHDEITELNRVRHYKVVFVDAAGKAHHVSFRLPLVAPDGTMLVNGIRSRMTKQLVNLPICKVSPSRVNLSSNYNKTLVERSQARVHSYPAMLSHYVATLARVGNLRVEYGALTSDRPLPYDYTALARTYARITGKAGWMAFDPARRFTAPAGDRSMPPPEHFQERERAFGVFFGRDNAEGEELYISQDNRVQVVSRAGSPLHTTTLLEAIHQRFGQGQTRPKMVAEWTELKILDKNFPIIFVLGYRFGLQATLRHLGARHRFVPKTDKLSLAPSEVSVAFADGTLVFDRYPLTTSLILSGLAHFNHKTHSFTEYDDKDVYYALLTEKRQSTNYLKGIDGFFELFVDPVTRDVLQRMGEPTTPRELLLRATEMLTDTHALPASSMANHRLRGYERFPDVVYNELARQLATYNNQRSAKKQFSINPEAVFMKILSDPTVTLVEDINPVHELKGTTAVTYTGMGGRTAQSFVIRDRVYPADGVGVLSEATPDSGKVAITAITSADPVLANARGMFDPAMIGNTEALQPTQVLSPAALLIPGVAQDD